MCKFWKSLTDRQHQIPVQTKVTFFDQHVLEYDPGLEEYATRTGIEVSPPALAMFLCWGGKVSNKEKGAISNNREAERIRCHDDISNDEYNLREEREDEYNDRGLLAMVCTGCDPELFG